MQRRNIVDLRRQARSGLGGSGSTAFSGVVDALIAAGVTPVGAYSTSHLLNAAYVGGPLFSLRRTSDNGIVDIPYNESTHRTDTAAMATHCGASNGLIPTLYDQSGNGNDITQATGSQQAKIYDSATGVNYQGTLPFAIFDASAQRWTRGDAMGITGNAQFTMAYFGKASSVAGRSYAMHLGPDGATGVYVGFEAATGDPMTGVTGVARENYTEATAITSTSLLTHIVPVGGLEPATTATAQQDGVEMTANASFGAVGAINIANTAFAIGTSPAGSQRWPGSACFWIVVSNALAGTALAALNTFGATLRGLD